MAENSNLKMNMLKEAFFDTEYLYNGKYKKETEKSIENTKFYPEKSSTINWITESENSEIADVIVTPHDSFWDAIECIDKGYKTTVLNFGSAVNPGGSVRYGGDTQEDCICRASNLLASISTEEMMQAFYRPHREIEDVVDDAGNITRPSLYNNDDIIYSPNILILKDFNNELSFPVRNIDVITCCAPEIEDDVSDGIYDILVKRISRIFEVAIENKTEALILGNWGCEDLEDTPKPVAKKFVNFIAKAFKENIDKYGKYLKVIVFPILGNYNVQTTFEEVLY